MTFLVATLTATLAFQAPALVAAQGNDRGFARSCLWQNVQIRNGDTIGTFCNNNNPHYYDYDYSHIGAILAPYRAYESELWNLFAQASLATVANLDEFRKSFAVFSEQSLANMDQSNVVAVGSSVVNCLLPVPPEGGTRM
ncbi:hypothetical protein HOO65_020629 [Ceratocystis lukuohia]|uniref:Uncharacterized protein n=1 Tax=Ceratocystis lukuohia TaxID=2019550 RepID=A0ABR4MP73_9PEZI